MKDVVQRGAVRDPAFLDNVVRFMAGNIGNITSTKGISDYLTSAGRKTTNDTIDNYLKLLENAYILYRARRYHGVSGVLGCLKMSVGITR